MSDTAKREWCWPWSHNWGRWNDQSGYTKTFVLTGKVFVFEHGVVQERRCKTCNICERRIQADG